MLMLPRKRLFNQELLLSLALFVLLSACVTENNKLAQQSPTSSVVTPPPAEVKPEPVPEVESESESEKEEVVNTRKPTTASTRPNKIEAKNNNSSNTVAKFEEKRKQLQLAEERRKKALEQKAKDHRRYEEARQKDKRLKEKAALKNNRNNTGIFPNETGDDPADEDNGWGNDDDFPEGTFDDDSENTGNEDDQEKENGFSDDTTDDGFGSEGNNEDESTTTDISYIDEDNTIIGNGNGAGNTSPIEARENLPVTQPTINTEELIDNGLSNGNQNTSTNNQEQEDISDCMSNFKAKGLAAWDTLPSVMYVGSSYEFQVLVDHISQGSKVLSKAAGEKINIEDVEVSEYKETTIAGHRTQIIKIGDQIKLKLESLTESAFDIRLLPDVKEIQKIDCEGPANWMWNIKPLEKGKHSLQMLISLANKEGNFEFFDSFKREINVKVEQPWYSAWYVKLLIGLGVLSLAYLIYVATTKKKSVAPIAVTAGTTTYGIANTSIPVQPTQISATPIKPNPSTLPHKVFLSYSHKDEAFKEKLDTHLSALKQTNIIDVWNDRQIPLGSEWDVEIKRELEESDVILLMISADFLASSYISEIEIPAAIARHDEGSAIVIPIFIRPCDWRGLPFEKLQGLPKNAKPLTTFDDIDVGLTEIAAGIRNRVS